MTFWRSSQRSVMMLALRLVSALSFCCVFPSNLDNTNAMAQSNGAKLTVPLSVEWKFTGNYYGQNPTSPVISNGVGYFASGNRIYAVSLKQGTQLWRYPATSSESLRTLVTVTPVLAKDTLFVGSGDGLYAFNAKEGKLLWHYQTNSIVLTTPVYFNDTLYFITDSGKVHAVDAKSGDVASGVWKSGNGLGLDTEGSASSEVGFANGHLLYATNREILHYLNLRTGVRAWVTRLRGADATSRPMVSGENVYLTFSSSLSNYRIANGQLRWTVPLPDNAAVPPAVDAEGNAYVVTDGLQIFALNSRGRGIWTKPGTLDYAPVSAPVVADGLLIVCTAYGFIQAFDTATGTLKWNYRVEPAGTDAAKVPIQTIVASAPVVSQGMMYTLGDDGTLTAFSPDASDTLPPAISKIEPQQGEYLNGRAPFRISAYLIDEGSGLNLSTMSFKLDGKEMPFIPKGSNDLNVTGFRFDLRDNLLEFSTVERQGRSATLAEGHHTATLMVKDWRGNTLTKTWSFFVDDTIPKRARRTTPGTNTGRPGGGSAGPGGADSGGGKGGGN